MTTILIIVAAIIVVGLMVLGLSITIIRKGHYIQGEVGENDAMKKRGLKCATQEIREEEHALGLMVYDDCTQDAFCGTQNCGTCSPIELTDSNKKETKGQ